MALWFCWWQQRLLGIGSMVREFSLLVFEKNLACLWPPSLPPWKIGNCSGFCQFMWCHFWLENALQTQKCLKHLPYELVGWVIGWFFDKKSTFLISVITACPQKRLLDIHKLYSCIQLLVCMNNLINSATGEPHHCNGSTGKSSSATIRKGKHTRHKLRYESFLLLLLLTQYHHVQTTAVLYWPSTQVHHLVTHSWANWI